MRITEDDIPDMNEQDNPRETQVPKLEGNSSKEAIGESAEERRPPSANLSMWAQSGWNFFPCEQAFEKLHAGQYICKWSSNSGPFFELVNTDTDQLEILPDSESVDIINDIEDFWSKEQRYRQYGFLWKRGYLLWGPPGSGKTATVQLTAKKFVEQDGVVAYVNEPDDAQKCISALRKIEPTRKLLLIMEDVDSIIERFGEHEVLAILDGEMQVDNLVTIATTNYPERLDKRIVNRPSRFDIVKRISTPNFEARKHFLTTKIGKDLPESEIEKWAKDTDGFSVAHLKELIVSVFVLDRPYDETLGRLCKMQQITPTSEDDTDKPTLGFRT